MADAPPADPLADLASLAPPAFSLTRVLSNDREAKTAALLGSIDGLPAIVRLAREPFSDEALASGAATAGVTLTPVVRNNCYLRATGTDVSPGGGPSGAPALAVEVICPATDKHIAKYSAQKRLTLRESFSAYQAVTLPAVLATPPERTAWVDNILAGTAEADRVLARWPPPEGGGGEGAATTTTTTTTTTPAQAAAAAIASAAPPCAAFVLLPDLKWDGADPARLYAVAIYGDPDLRSLRDLDTADRLAAVRTAHAACLAALAASTGARPSTLRSFFHYHPSYWRLHVHYAAHGVPAADGLGKAHAVEDVLGEGGGGEGGGSLWARRALTVCLGEDDPLAGPLGAWMEGEEADQACGAA